MDIKLSDKRLFLKADLSGTGISPGAEIVAINDVSGHDIASSMLASESGESATYLESYLSGQFQKRHWSLYGESAVFEVLLADADAPVALPAKPYAEIAEALARKKQGALPSLRYEAGTPVLTVSNFESPRGEFAKAVKSIFDDIQSSGTGALVIDIRDNGGGDSTYGDLLLSYLGDTKYEQIERVEIKSSAEIKIFYKTLLPDWAQWFDLSLLHPTFKGIYSTADGETFVYRFAEPQPYKNLKKNRFKGDIALIIGPRTYSSGAIFAAPFKHYRLATIVGEETGEPAVFYGDNYTFDLPVTKLEATVSHKRFVTAGGVEDGRGILPDLEAPIEIQPDGRDLALEAALAALKP